MQLFCDFGFHRESVISGRSDHQRSLTDVPRSFEAVKATMKIIHRTRHSPHPLDISPSLLTTVAGDVGGWRSRDVAKR